MCDKEGDGVEGIPVFLVIRLFNGFLLFPGGSRSGERSGDTGLGLDSEGFPNLADQDCFLGGRPRVCSAFESEPGFELGLNLDCRGLCG